MYTTCIFCHGDLGRNERIEALPIGRRIAFDGERGRLWVVCRRCQRWNLTPFEERWEAIEECERFFRGTRLRVSTDNIGLAKLADGLELVRVGEALRPEFAAWRYGDQFGRRRRRQMILTGGGLVIAGGVVAGGVAAGVGIGGFGWLISQLANRIVNGSPDAVVARVPTADGVLPVKRKYLARTAIVESDRAPFALELRLKRGTVTLDGEHATRAASLLMPATNRFGGAPQQIQGAVSRIEESGDPSAFLSTVARLAAPTRVPRRGKSPWTGEPQGGLLALGKVERLAIEMALQEESERRAMEGELAELERAWKEAEEIAAISDNLLLPESTERRVEELRARGGVGPQPAGPA